MRVCHIVHSIAFPSEKPLGLLDTTMFRGMIKSDQFGFYDSLGRLLAVHGPRLQKADVDDRTYAILSQLRERYLEARAIERQHGKGSLLNLAHLTVATMIARGQLLSVDEVTAAVKFQETQGTFYSKWRALDVTISSTS